MCPKRESAHMVLIPQMMLEPTEPPNKGLTVFFKITS